MQDIISQVKDAEKKAEDIIKAAKENCDKIINDAKIQSQKERQEILDKADMEREEILKAGKLKANEAYSEKIKQFEIESMDLENRAKLGYENAISFVLERMVE